MQEQAPQPRPESNEAYPELESKLPASAAIKETVIGALDSRLSPGDGEADTALFTNDKSQTVYIQQQVDKTRVIAYRGVASEGDFAVDGQGEAEKQAPTPASETVYFFTPNEDGYEAYRQDVLDASDPDAEAEDVDLSHKEAKELLDSLATLTLVKKFPRGEYPAIEA